jgi:hypothetical protein
MLVLWLAALSRGPVALKSTASMFAADTLTVIIDAVSGQSLATLSTKSNGRECPHATVRKKSRSNTRA